MSPTMTYLLIVLLAGGAYALGRILRAHARRPRVRILLLPLLVLLALPWCLGIAYYAHILDRPWYYEFRAWRGTDYLMALFALPLAVFLPPWDGPEHPYRNLLRFLLGPLLAIGCVTVVFAKPLLLPLHLDPLAARWRDGVCLQTSSASCGPCAVATVLRARGVNLDEAQLAKEAQTSRTGTLNWLLLRALRERGFTAIVTAPRDLTEVVAPAVVGVTLGSGAGHFVAYLGRNSEGITIGDPLEGRLVLDERRFREKYQFRRFALQF